MSVHLEIPSDLKYTEEHEWLRHQGDTVAVGITAFAASQLGDVVFVELPAPGAKVQAKQPFGVVESVKSVSELFAPISGTVTESNKTLEDSPEKVNEDPYGSGWMIRIRPDNPADVSALMDAKAYQTLLEGS